MDAAVEQVEEKVDGLGPHAGPTGGERVRPQQEDRARDIDRKRIADPRGMAAQEVELQLDEVLARDPDLGERAESGVDAVDRRIAVRELGDELGRRPHELLG